MKLKKPNENNEHNLFICARLRCKNGATIVISTSRPEYALCELDWCRHCDEETEEYLQGLT